MNLFNTIGNTLSSGWLKLGKWWKTRLSQGYIFGQEQAVWIKTKQPYLLFESVPQLKTIVRRKALMFSNMEFKLTDKNTGAEIVDEKLFALLKNPNVTKSMNQFLEQYKMQEQIYGNQFMYKFKPTTVQKYPSALWNMPTADMKTILSGKMFQQTDIKNIVLRYEYCSGGKTQTYETETILYSTISDLDDPIIGKSPVESLYMPLTNMELAYEYRNVIMRKRGALGILSRDAKDTTGGLNLTEQKKELSKDYTKAFGIGEDQAQFLITEAALKWQAMSYPTKDLMLFEEIDADTLVIIDAFGMNANIFSTKNSTYENVKQSLISVYQDTIQPEADKFVQALSKFLQLPDNYNLQASYEHIAILKQNTNYADIKPMIEALTQSITAGILTIPQATTILQNEMGKYFNTEGVFDTKKSN